MAVFAAHLAVWQVFAILAQRLVAVGALCAGVTLTEETRGLRAES